MAFFLINDNVQKKNLFQSKDRGGALYEAGAI